MPAGGTRTRSVYVEAPTVYELLTRWYDPKTLGKTLRVSPSREGFDAADYDVVSVLLLEDLHPAMERLPEIMAAIRNRLSSDRETSKNGFRLGTKPDHLTVMKKWSVDERVFDALRCRLYAVLCLRVNLGHRLLERERTVTGSDAAIDRASYRALKLELFLESHAPLCAWFCARPESDPNGDSTERFSDDNLPAGAPTPGVRERRCANDWCDREAENDERDPHERATTLAWHRIPTETLLGKERNTVEMRAALSLPDSLYLRPLVKICDAFETFERRVDSNAPEENESEKTRALAAHLRKWTSAFRKDCRPETEALRTLHALTNPKGRILHRCGLWALTYCAWRCETKLISETEPTARRALHDRRMALLPLYRWTWARARVDLSTKDDAMPLTRLCPRGYDAATADAASARGLPQMSTAVHRMRFWYESHDEKLAAVRGPEKALPFRSHGRSIARMLCNTCDDSDAYFLYVQRLLFCSIVGGYFVDSYRPRLDTIRRVTAATARDKATVVRFLRAQPLLVPYVLQEHLVYAMRSLPHLRETQSLPHLRESHETVEWPEFERKVRATMDAYREHLDAMAVEHPDGSDVSSTIGKSVDETVFEAGTDEAEIETWSFERKLVRRDNNKARFPYQKKSFVQRVLDRVRNVQGDLQLAELVYEETLNDLTWARSLHAKRDEQLRVGSIIRAAATERKITNALRKAATYRSDVGGDDLFASAETASNAAISSSSEVDADVNVAIVDIEARLAQIRSWIAVPPNVKRDAWILTFGECAKNDEGGKRRTLSDLLTERGVNVLTELIDLYVRRVSPSELNEVLGDLPIEIVSRLYFVLRVLTFARSVQLVPLDMASARRVETAMRDRYRLTHAEELPPRAYHVHLTPCCRRVATFTTSHSYGNQKIVYDSHRRRYACGKKASAKGGGNRAAAKFGVGVPTLNKDGRVFSLRDEKPNDKRKLARQVKRQRDQVPCAGTPIVTLNLMGRRLVFGSTPKVQASYRHCLRCANLYRCEVRVRPGSYGGDAICDRCSETMPERAACAPCFHCRQPLIVSSATSHFVVDLDDCERPLKRRRYCDRHAPSARGRCGFRSDGIGARKRLIHADEHRAYLLSQQNRMVREMDRDVGPAERARRNASIRRNAARWDPRNRQR